MTVQTRSELYGLMQFNSLKEAFKEAEKDLSIWKISFDAPNGERVRLVRRPGDRVFYYEPILQGLD